jgi:CBS domain-containing protein
MQREAGMRTIDRLRRSGVAIGPERTLREAAGVMDQAGVGALAIIDGSTRRRGDRPRPGPARPRPWAARRLRVDAVMSTPVVTTAAEADLHDAFALLRSNALRRLAVVRDGQFVGVITVDDSLIELAGDLADLARPVTVKVVYGQRDAPLPTTS